MKQMSLVAFDDHMTSSGMMATATSSDQDALTMGMFDQIAFTVTAEQIEGSNPRLQVQLWHSADGVYWLEKNPGVPEVPYQFFSAVGSNVYVGFDDGLSPSLRYLRFVLTIQTDAPGFDTAVRVDAVLNDERENAFAAKMRKTLQEQADMNQCASYVQGGDSTTNADVVAGAWDDGSVAANIRHAEGESPLASEFSCDPNFSCTLASDASACIHADGSVALSSPRTNIVMPSQRAGKTSSCS